MSTSAVKLERDFFVTAFLAVVRFFFACAAARAFTGNGFGGTDSDTSRELSGGGCDADSGGCDSGGRESGGWEKGGREIGALGGADAMARPDDGGPERWPWYSGPEGWPWNGGPEGGTWNGIVFSCGTTGFPRGVSIPPFSASRRSASRSCDRSSFIEGIEGTSAERLRTS
jgi:hypothetical protein